MHKTIHTALLPLIVAGVACAQGPQAPAPDGEEDILQRGVPIAGIVLWPGQDLTTTYVKVYSDPTWRQLVAEYPTGGSGGSIGLVLDPGTYYIMVLSDQDDNKRLSPGDGLGFYGVSNPRNRPQALIVDEKASGLYLTIPIVAEMDAEMKLIPTQVPVAATDPGANDVTLSGSVGSAEPAQGPRFALLLPAAPLRQPRVAAVDAEGRFTLVASSNVYQFIVIEARGDTPAIGEGNLAGLYGYHAAMGPSLPLMELHSEQTLQDMQVLLSWSVDEAGRLVGATDGSEGPRLAVGMLPAIITGRVTRHGAPMGGALLKAYADSGLRTQCNAAVADVDGRFCMALVAGSYYLVAIHDVDGNERLSPGDELGFGGVADVAEQAGPQATVLDVGQVLADLDIPLIMALDAEARPVPLTETAETTSHHGDTERTESRGERR